VKRIGIVVALAAERRSLKSRRLSECGGLVAVSGAGPRAARAAALRLVADGADGLVSWGCAAALAPVLKPGDLVLPSRIIGADGSPLETTRSWRDGLSARLAGRLPVRQGVLAESVEIVSTPAEKQALHAATSAIALDMESASVARAAQASGLPFLAVRAIADPAAMRVPGAVSEAMDEDGQVRLSKLLVHALLNPGDLIGLAQIGWHFRAALKTLRVVDAVGVTEVFGQGEPMPSDPTS
jgi:adenosylhomocysteine nucleosidase